MELTREQFEALRRLISERRESLTAVVHEDVARSRDETYAAVAGDVVDTGDEAVADLLSDLDNAEVARDLRELREIEAAQDRIADGSYGTSSNAPPQSVSSGCSPTPSRRAASTASACTKRLTRTRASRRYSRPARDLRIAQSFALAIAMRIALPSS